MGYLVDVLVVKDEPLSEAIIKEAHHILMSFSEHEETGGVYRDTDEAASHGLRPETDSEYQQRVKDARR
ncbi:MAG: hypothetical protein M1818_003754 [Claussenomyces sp. TS43310]|nr:MAG: hypothetical protein M1818_003754 [Claussenomyces sp. TS43310]